MPNYSGVARPEDKTTRDQFFNFNQQQETSEGNFEDVVPMDQGAENIPFTPGDGGVDIKPPMWENVAQTEIDISEDLPETDGFSIDISEDATNVFQDAGYAEQKAEKIDFALGLESPGKAVIQSALELGDEGPMRDLVASRESQKMQEAWMGQIKDTLANAEGGLTPEEAQGIVYLSKNKPQVDPNSVLEEVYGKKFTEKAIDLPATKSKFREAMDGAPDDVLDGLDAVASMVAKREMVNDVKKDLEHRLKQQSTLGLIGDYAQQFVPLQSYGNLADTSGGEVTPQAARGENRLQNYEYFRTLTPSRFKKEFKEAYDRIAESNLLDAQSFVDGYMEYSNADATLDDVLGYLDWAQIPGLAVGAGALLKYGARRVVPQGKGTQKGSSSSPTDATASPSESPITPPAPDKEPETFTVVPRAAEEGKKHTQFNPKTNTLTVDPDRVKSEWAGKPWRKYGLNDEEFPLPDDWYNFWVERYKVSKFLNRKDFPDKNAFAKAINEFALGSLKSGQRNAETKQILKDTARAASAPTVEDALSQVGETNLAASIRAHKRAKEEWDGKDPLGDSVDLKNRTVSLYYPHEIFDNAGSLDRALTERLKTRALNSASKLLNLVTNNANVVRTTDEAITAAIDVAKKQMARDYDRVADAVLDVDLGGPFNVITPEQQAVNNYTLEYRLGKITRKAPEATKAPQAPAPKAAPQESVGPKATGDELLDSINKYTAKNGRMLLKDLYDQMKRDGTYKGTLADFRGAVAKYYNTKAIKASHHEGKLPPLSPPRKVAPLAKAPAAKANPLERLVEDVALNARRSDGERLFDSADDVRERIAEEVKDIPAIANSMRQGEHNWIDTDEAGRHLPFEIDEKEDEFFLPTRSDTDILARVAHDPGGWGSGTLDGGPSAPALAQVLHRLYKKNGDKITPGQVQKVLDYASGKLTTTKLKGTPDLEEGNFASEFRRDIGYGSETHRNRIIDSEIVYKPATKYTSPRRFHYIEPPEGFPQKAVPSGAKQVALGHPKFNPTHLTGYGNAKGETRGLVDAVTDLLSKLRKYPNPKLHDRLTRIINKLETRAKRNLGVDERGPDPALNTSPYQEQFGTLNRRQIKGPDGKTKTQIDVGDVDRRYKSNRALSAAEKEAYAKLEREVYDHIATVSAKRPRKEEPYVVEKKLGKPTAELFKSEAQAAQYGTRLYGLSPNQFKIRQQGAGYYISIQKVVDETVVPARDLMTTTSNKSREGFLNAVLGYIFTPDGQLSDLANANRKIATYAPGEMHRIMQEAAEEIRSLPRLEREELGEILEANRDVIKEVKLPNGETKAERGYFYKDVAEFENDFKKRFDKMPSEGQIGSYFEYVRLYDTDYVLRNLALHRDLGRLGLEKTRLFTHIDNDGQVDSIPSKWFSSREIDDLPLGEMGEDWGVFVYDDSLRGGSFHLRSQLTKEVLDDIYEKKNNHGYRLLELGNPLEKPLRSVVGNDETVNFVLVKNFEKVKYDWAALPYRPGGHVEYGDKWFVKQPRIRRTDASGVQRHVFEGDTSLLNASSEAEAKQLAEAVDQARLLLRKGTPDAELEEFLHRNTPYELDQFKAFFKERVTDTGEVIPPKLHIDDAITFTYTGRNTFDMDHFKGKQGEYQNFVDAIRSKYNIFANGVDKKYLGARDPDLPAVEIGNGETPMMTLTKPRLIDPLDTINSSLANAIRSKYLNDYKAYSVESFIQEYHTMFDKKITLDELRRNPVYYLHNPVWDTETTNFEKLNAAKNARIAIINFLGTNSFVGEFTDWAQQKLINQIYGNLGQSAANKVTASKWLPFEKDPIAFLRGVAFHLKLGLYNVKQLWTQMQTVVHVAGVEGPVAAMQAAPKALAARWLSLTEDPDVIRGVVQKLGLQDTDFTEAYDELRKTGFYNIGGETASRDDYFEPKIFTSRAGTFLEKGTFFFKEGERVSRLTAWFTAFSKWRAANPGKPVTNSVRNLILDRADTLAVNQSRASNSALQNGIGSVPTQFWSYQWRLAEQILGPTSKLTAKERLRAFLTHSAMYGIPVGLSSGAVYPFYDDFRQAALERGINMDDKQIQTFHDGLVSTIISAATGEQYNFSQTYGPAGLSVIKDIAEGEKTIIDLVIGAGGQTTVDMVKALGVGAEYLHSLFTFDQKDGPTMSDIIDVTKNVSSVNSTLQAWSMYNTGRYVTKQGSNVVNDATTMDAFMQGIFGLQKNEVGDTFRMIESLKEQKEYEEVYRKEVLKYFRQSLKAQQDGDSTGAEVALNKARAAFIAGGFRPDQMGEIAKRAAQQNESLFEAMQKQFVKKAPAAQQQDRLDAAIEHKKNNETGRGN